MSVSDELQERIEQLQKQPSSGVEKRGESEAGEILESGRTVEELIVLLTELRDVVVSCWDNDELERLPAGLRQNLKNQLQKVLNASQHYANQQNQAQDLEQRVDQLHAILWQNNLIDRPEKLPGFERKNKQLEALKQKAREIVNELESGLTERNAIVQLREEADELKKQIAEIAEKVKLHREDTAEWASEADETLRQTKQHETAAQQAKETAEGALERAKNSADEASAQAKQVKAFVGEIEDARSTMKMIERTAQSTVEANDETTQELIETNKELEQQVKDQLQRATGGSLFKEFNRRKKEISVAKWIWGGLTVATLVFAIFWGVELAGSAADLDTAFFVKLGATLPLLIVVVFCLRQYGRERQAEEEYAFKSALSLSLVPYKKLVEDLETGEKDAEYAKFLTKTIGQIYEPPTRPDKPDSSDDELVSLSAVRKITELIEKVMGQ